jgi:hypothetical protein
MPSAEAAKGILIGLGSTDWRWKTWIFFPKGEHTNYHNTKVVKNKEKPKIYQQNNSKIKHQNCR